MKLYLIRHGETVDNVAGLYAGVRDSALTNYGVDQTRYLGKHFAKGDRQLTHIFASPLSRAYRTAEELQKAQNVQPGGEDLLEIIKVPDLIEQDFGYYEGQSFHARSKPGKSGKDSHREIHKADPNFKDVESKESLDVRADRFLDEHLVPIIEASGEFGQETQVAIVSHGILLAHLWRRLLVRLPRKSLQVSSEITASKGSLVLEHLGGWSNTGYLELHLGKETVATKAALPGVGSSLSSEAVQKVDSSPVAKVVETGSLATDSSSSKAGKAQGARRLDGWFTVIAAVDSRQHLVGLKRQRGGIGSMKHDEGQRKLDGFFIKKPRAE